MSDILNHNRNLIDFELTNEDYWDFHLSEEMGYIGGLNGFATECLSTYIDFNDPNCVFWDEAISKNEYVWEKSVNEGVTLGYIGVTGVDNGLITYEKDRITNKEFLELFLRSKYETEAGDKRLRLKKVNGNNQIYDYSNNIVNVDNKDVSELNGGFYQGFFKIYDKEYQVLPYVIENGWSIEVRLKKSDLENQKLTINDTHPNNKGIFFYIGTRAENKWWKLYSVEQTVEENNVNKYVSTDYIDDSYTTESQDVNSEYLQKDDGEETAIDKDYIGNDYIVTEESQCNQYVEDGYIEKDEEITGKEDLITSEGFSFGQPNIIQYDTDNKFLLFDRTEDGFTVKNWEDGTVVTMYDIKKPDLGNYFTLFNRTPKGYTVKTIDSLVEEKNKNYNILKDLYRNALAFQIKDNGSIGFKYLVKDCESEEENYKIEELFSKENIIKDDEWYNISIKIMPTVPNKIINPLCDNITTTTKQEMVIYIYVNGKLKLKSEVLPMLNLKQLDDLSDKQQAVPFALSLGGGTQGLCDVINLNYRELPKEVLPLEKEFCGSFIGYIQKFRFYACPLNFTEIGENYIFDLNN